MKETQTLPSHLLPQPFCHSPAKADRDAEPFRRAPVPKAFPSPGCLSGFAPDPLLTITPEKSLASRQAGNYGKTFGGGERKGRQRVRFAPDTRTSPPAKDSSLETEKKRSGDTVSTGIVDSVSKVVSEDEDSVPRSFSAVSHKLYHPGRYTDEDESKTSKFPSTALPSKSSSSVSAPKRYSVETQGNKMVYVPLDHSVKNITSAYSGLPHHKPVSARVVRHKPAHTYNVSDDEESSTELKEAFGSSNSWLPPFTSPHTPSPSFPHTTPHQSRTAGPNRRSPSPAKSRSPSPAKSRSPSPAKSPNRRGCSPCPSPERRTPVEGSEVLSPDPLSQPAPQVHVIREAPYQPRPSHYVFPFDPSKEGQGYDPSTDNPLARPEFNSALKISQELKSAKGKQPDTWGAVAQKLKTCDKKRTQIQEKASSRVNIHREYGLYSDLVDVDVPLEDLCDSLEKGVGLRAHSPTPPSIKVPVGKEPDLFEFFSPELQPELPDLTLTGIGPITETLTTADPMLAFDLYRHNRAWNGLTDS